MGYSLSEQLELHIINYWIMWSVSKSPIGCNILPKCLSAVITDTKISSHSGRLTIIVTQFVTNIKAPLGNYEIPISGLRIGGTIYSYLKRQSDFFTIFAFHRKEMWKVSLSTLPLIWWRPKCTLYTFPGNEPWFDDIFAAIKSTLFSADNVTISQKAQQLRTQTNV